MHEIIDISSTCKIKEKLYIAFSACRDTPNGETYIGMLSHTVYGNQCLRWDSLNASNPVYAAVLNLKGNISSHANYCRNPDRKTAPWCFVGGDLQWEYCDIQFCKRGKYMHAFNITFRFPGTSLLN